MRAPDRIDTRVGSRARDAGALSSAVLTWIAIGTAGLAAVAGLGWAGVFDGDDPPSTFIGVVRDSQTGVGLGGLTVAATDVSGAPITGLSATTTVDGEYRISDLTSDEYGLFVTGSAIGHETGYVASASGPYGHDVVATWGAAATYAPGVVGDIALDPLSGPGTTTIPTTTVPTTTVPATAEPPAASTTAPSGFGPTTTAASRGPTIGTLTATPNLVSPSRVCGTSTTQFSVNVTQPSGVKSVVVQWSYPTAPAGALPGTASGTATLTHKAGTDTWIGGASFWQQPATAPQTWVTLKVVATANDTHWGSRTFTQTLAIERC